MYLLDFIHSHPTSWRALLRSSPYSLYMSEDRVLGRNLMLLCYTINSDMSLPLVQECRGVIIDVDSLEVISYPFNKFFNLHEEYHATIDWSSAYTTRKIDGSICKIVRLGQRLLISTNKTIDAFNAEIQNQLGCPYKTFGDVILQGLQKASYEGGYSEVNEMCMDIFEEGYTYIFELVSPYTKIVIPYNEIWLYLIGVRNNHTFQEIFFNDSCLSKIQRCFQRPQCYLIGSEKDVVKAAESLPETEEGFVVVDKYFNRIKVKSLTYVRLHHMRGEGVLTYSAALAVYRQGKAEVDELLSYFPEYESAYRDLEEKINNIEEAAERGWDEFYSKGLTSRKEQAQYITQHCFPPAYFFSRLDNKATSFHEWFCSLNDSRIMNILNNEQKHLNG